MNIKVKLSAIRKSDGSKIVSSTKGLWHLFVGRLSKEAIEDDIREHLETNGITVSEVRKLKATQEWQEKVSAFRVSIDLKFKDTVMDADLWPDNVEVRDWVFKQ